MTTIRSISTITSLSIAALLTPALANAIDVGGMDIGIQPRFETGMMNYKMDVNPVGVSSSPAPGQLGSNYAQKKFSIKDNLFLFGGGATLFIEQFFADLSALRAINGNDNTTFGFSEFNQGPGSSDSRFTNSSSPLKSDFDRNEYAISLGYSITKQLSIFTGYKWIKTSIDADGSGYFNQVSTGPANDRFPQIQGSDTSEGTTYSKESYEFKYHGPFLGLNYGLEIKQGWLEGILSFNSAVAYLDGKLKRRHGETYITINQIDGVSVAPQTVVDRRDFLGSEGNTIGLTFGINWRGYTPVENLTYSLGINGYKYNFDASNSDKPDVNETVVNFKVGVAYAF